MDIPIEVWAIIFSYLRLNDLIEISSVCKTFYCLCQKNYFYVKKLHESRDIFKDRSWLFQSYRKLLERFYFGIYREILLYFRMTHIHMLKKEIFYRLYYSLLPFRVWNRVFFCCGSQYERSMCLFCTKIRLKN